MAEKNARAMADAYASVKDAALAIGTALATAFSVREIVQFMQAAIDTGDRMGDLARSTGMTVEQIGGLGFAASQAGGNLDSISVQMERFNALIGKADSGNKTARAGFDAMGISLTNANGSFKTSAQLLPEVADKFNSYAEGPLKAALGLAVFQKGYAEILPLLHQGSEGLAANAEYFARYSGMTTQAAEASDKFNDQLAKFGVHSTGFRQAIVDALLPALSEVVKALIAIKEEGTGVPIVITALRIALETIVVSAANVIYVLQQVGQTIGAIIASAVALMAMRISPEGITAAKAALGSIWDSYNEQAGKARARVDEFSSAVVNAHGKAVTARATEQAEVTADTRPQAPKSRQQDQVSDDAKLARLASAMLKTELEGRIKLIQEFGKQQADVAKFNDELMTAVYGTGMISLKDFTAAEIAIRAEGLAATLNTLDKEVAAYRAHGLGLIGKDRIDNENKIKEAIALRATEVQKGAQAEQLAAVKSQQAMRDKQTQLQALTASILVMEGETRKASALTIAAQVEAATKTVTEAGGSPDLIERDRVMLQGKADLSEALTKYNLLLAQEASAELAVTNAAIRNGESQSETDGKLASLRTVQIAALTEKAAQAERLAKVLNTPDSIAFAQLLTDELGSAAAKISTLRGSIESTIGSSLVDLFKGNTQSIMALWSDMLTKMAAEALAKKLTAALFNSGGGGSSGMGWLGSIIGLFTGGGGGSQGGGQVGSIKFGAFGGNVDPYSLTGVNERGTELLQMGGRDYLMTGAQGGRIVPSNMLGGGAPSTSIVFNISSGVSRNELAAMIPGMTAHIKGEIQMSMRRPGWQGR